MRPFELQSFEEELRAQEQVAKAKELLQAAIKECDRIREEARREGLEKGRAEALAEARKLERERLTPEVAALRDHLKKVVESIEAKRAELVAAAERDLVRLSLAIAEKIVKHEVRAPGAAAIENVRHAVELTANRQVVRILVHPEDLKAIDSHLPSLRQEFTDVLDISADASEAVGRGGCVVSTREGLVDGTVAVQLEEIERGLLG
jgi:flagellar assembly protein FliH